MNGSPSASVLLISTATGHNHTKTSQTQSPLKLHRAGLNPSKYTQYWNPGVWRTFILGRLSIDWIERSTLQFIFFLFEFIKVFPELLPLPPPTTTTTINRANSYNFIPSCTKLRSPKPQACKLKNKYNISICKVTDLKKKPKTKCYKLFVCVYWKSLLQWILQKCRVVCGTGCI